MEKYLHIFIKEFNIATKTAQRSIFSIIFFILSFFIFILSTGPNLLNLEYRGILISVSLIIFILSTLLTLDELFQRSYNDGSLAFISRSPASFNVIITIKIVNYWILNIFPLVITNILLLKFIGINEINYKAFLIVLFTSSAILTLLNAFIASLVVDSTKRGVIAPLLLLPLSLPTIIYSSDILVNNTTTLLQTPIYFILLGILLINVPIVPIICAKILQFSLKHY